MKYPISVSLQLAAMVILVSNVSAKSWQGITPLHSTRIDVEKLWGKPLPPPPDSGRAYTLHEGRSIYFTDEGEVYVLYAGFISGCDKRVTPDTVVWVSISLKRKMQLSELRIDKSRFRTYDPATPKGLGYKAYTDEREGYSILTYNGIVEQIYYQPTSADRKLCPSYFENGRCIPFSLYLHT